MMLCLPLVGCAGNGAAKTPSQIPAETESPYPPADKLIAITFDDGPNESVMVMVLDLLEQHDVTATFFVVGNRINESNSKILKRAYDMGCEIGLHTFNHKNIYFESKKEDAPDELIEEELSKIANLYTGITGKTTYLLRPPGGGFNKTRNYGYTLILWNVDSEDWVDASAYYKNPTAETLEQAAQKTAARVLKDVSPGDIVLMHDIHPTSVKAFELIYSSLKAQGYRFVTVSELLNIKGHEHTGQYFFSSYRFGQNDVISNAPDNGQNKNFLPPIAEEEVDKNNHKTKSKDDKNAGK
jgi:peptidoglycan/xylan/chitin deacetylase (PgdA/CDA1 family)